MATLISRNNGNFTDASAWGLVDSTSLNSSIAATTNLTTSYVLSTAFTPGAITVDGISVYIGARLGSTGTMSIALHQAGALVSGTEVTINVSDLPNIPTYVAGLGVGWVFFKFASPVLLSAATAYTLGAKTSTATMIALRSSATTNWSRQLRTTTTQAPATSDNLVIAGEWTAVATVASITITMQNTTTTAFGSVDVCNNGTLAYAFSAATNYYLKTLDVNVRPIGTLTIGTVLNPIPSGSTAVLELTATSSAQYGLIQHTLSTITSVGAAKTVHTPLTVDSAVSATSFTVASTTGWVIGDEVCLPGTTRSISLNEKLTLATIPTGTTFTTTVGATNAHSSAAEIQAEIGNLTRNVKIRGMTTTNTGYIYSLDGSTLYFENIELTLLGSSTATKRGVEINGTTTIKNCALHNWSVSASSHGIYIGTVATINIENNVFYNFPNHITITAGTSTGITVDNNLFVKSGSTSMTVANKNIICTNNLFYNITNASMDIGPTAFYPFDGEFSNCRFISCGGGLSFSQTKIGDITFDVFHFALNSSASYAGVSVLQTIYGINAIFNNFTMLGNNSQHIRITDYVIGQMVFNNLVCRGHSAGATLYGIYTTTNGPINKIIFNNSTFGETIAHTNSDIETAMQTNVIIELNNTKLASATEFGTLSNLNTFGYISSQNHDQVVGAHKVWKTYGIISSDSTIYDTVSSSMRITPNSTTDKIQGGRFHVPVTSGNNTDISIKVRKSVVGDGATYNGNQPRLILLANPAAGIDSNVIISTATNAANGAWETLTGTSPEVDIDCILEFSVDCDGTAGWVNVDGFAVDGGTTSGMSYWSSGQPEVFAVEATPTSVDIAY